MLRMLTRRPSIATLVCVLCAATFARAAAAAPQASAQGAGVIEGRVVDGATGEPLPGAKVVVTGSASETSTDREGTFRLSGVPAGDRTVVVTYLGRQDAVVEAKVIAG